VIGEVDAHEAEAITRSVFCSGKVYYDLLEQRRAGGHTSVALVRLEQIYPFPIQEYQATLAGYPNAKAVVWCQEEPQNQGAWYQIRHRLQESLDGRSLLYAGRAGAAAPATGIHELHALQQQALVQAALQATVTQGDARATTRAPARPSAVAGKSKSTRKLSS
jgi:2-oxoglutarate dehydrogenase E1 component